MEPIKSFRDAQSCDAVDPFTCLCVDKTLSEGLRTAIMDKCHNGCGPSSVSLGTKVLDDYCTMNEPATASATQTDDKSSSKTIASTTSSGSRSESTGPSPTSTPTPETKGGGEKTNGLSLGEKLGIAAALSVGIPTVVFGALGWRHQRNESRKKNAASAAAGVDLEPIERAGTGTKSSAPAPYVKGCCGLVVET